MLGHARVKPSEIESVIRDHSGVSKRALQQYFSMYSVERKECSEAEELAYEYTICSEHRASHSLSTIPMSLAVQYSADDMVKR